MVRRERARAGRAVRLRELLEAGDHRAAAAEARAVLAGEAGGEDARAAAEALASLRPEPGAVAAGAGAVALSVAVLLWSILGTGR